MIKTDFYCTFNLVDTTALEDSRPESSTNKEFANINIFKERIQSQRYGTLEKDFFKLDGSFEQMPDKPEDIAYFSEDIAEEDGTFKNEQGFTIYFSENHSSYGLTFHFADDYPEEMEIEWFDMWNISKRKEKFTIDSKVFFAKRQVKDYGKIKVVFTKARPGRYVKVNYIDYGTQMVFGLDGLPIKDAKMNEETDMLSDKIPINTLSLKLIDENEDYNPANSMGLHQVLQKGQIVTAYESRNDIIDFLGIFYLTGWKNTKNLISFSFQDMKGQLDNYNFTDGKVYNGELAGPVIEQILSNAKIEEYEIEDEVYKTKLYGYLKIQTCRKALREILFAAGAIIETSRNKKMIIRKENKDYQFTIQRSRKFSTTIENVDRITNVSIKYSNYTLQNEEKEIAKGTYEAGIHTIQLSNPARNVSIDVGTIIKSNDNYITFSIPSKSNVIIKGNQFKKEDFIYEKSLDDKEVSAGTARQSKSYTAAVANEETAKTIAENIIDYYKYSLSIKIKYMCEAEKNNSWGIVENKEKGYGDFISFFEKITTDLTGGYLSTATLKGYYNMQSEDIYAGNELIAGEEGLI